MRFSTTTRPTVTIVGPCLTANDDGTYGVGRGFITPDLGLFDSVHDAVAVAVRELPSGLGPVTLGSFPGPSSGTEERRSGMRCLSAGSVRPT
nr:DUF6193 family natural product biosynthesis protein [Streptomyces sp. SID161]